MAKSFAWLLFLVSVAAFGMGVRAQWILADADHMRREIAKPLPQKFASADSADYLEP